MIETLLALLPAIVLLVLIYKADSLEHEPWDLVLKTFGLGVLSVVVIILAESMLDGVFVLLFGEDSMAYVIIGTLIGVALVEEFFKLCASMALTWNNREFNYVFDGVVFCAAAALGYAAIENVFYVLDSGSDFLYTAAIRGVISVPSHMVDGIFMGIFMGFAKLAKYEGNRAKMKRFIALALIVPICEHCLFDVLCTIEADGADLALYALVVVEYIIAFVIILKFRGKGDVPIPIPAQAAMAAAQQSAQVVMPTHAAILAGGQELCPVCRSVVLDGASFCVSCGYNLQARQRFCTNCGAELRDGASFCQMCGASVIG